MQDVNYLRDLARHCRALLKTAKEPEVIDQLRVWAVDFADEADDAERRAGEREEVQVVGFGERTESVARSGGFCCVSDSGRGSWLFQA
jgi:hypothetical protein